MSQLRGIQLAVLFGLALGFITLAACEGRFEHQLTPEPDSPEAPQAEQARESWRAALAELVLPLIEEHDTQYAQGFKEDVFRSLKIGSSQAEVIGLLGPPLSAKICSKGSTCWYYSRPGPRSENYYVRVLVFAHGGGLAAKLHSFYLD